MSVTHPQDSGARGSTAAAIRAHRERLDVTQAQVAQALGLHQSSVSLKEQGKVPFTVEELYRLAEYFDVPITSFFSPRLRAPRFSTTDTPGAS